MARIKRLIRHCSSFLLIVACACVYVAAHTPLNAASRASQGLENTSTGYATQATANTVNPSPAAASTGRRLCARRAHPGELQSGGIDYGPCLLVDAHRPMAQRQVSVRMV